MKKKYLFVMGAALMLLASCSTHHRYGCRSGRCIVESQKATKPTPQPNTKRNA
ncbi:hypothetical protein GR160_13120 [Flavobacterium sp. Sd200]|uniref:hypothetical protein n=1 Tax=Flavobacterium sp. Sd200 TaxID=2692211 RepID=UPI0013713B97|nr:hypothetical protein [Flavobacterium sp. Sd200]MXN92169.1 hypothetical protein [Flavobacterium sp. Sd200]